MSPGTLPSLSDIQHVVILMQENRSFDHYFGRLSGVGGSPIPTSCATPSSGKNPPVWKQYGYKPGVGVDPSGFLEPFHLIQNPPTEDGATTNDISHEWTTQHDAWNSGAMDNFVGAHLAADGVDNFAVTMGYFKRSDLAFYYALADAFTICDAYHCSVLGPTDPNRVMAFSASHRSRPAPAAGPSSSPRRRGRPAAVQHALVDDDARAAARCGRELEGLQRPDRTGALQPAPLLQGLQRPDDDAGQQLQAQALTPAFPADFIADVTAGTLPQVSWIHGPVVQCEHPATAPQWGENLVQTVLDTLTSNPDVWAQTLFILHYDENGGFFDHVPAARATSGHRGRVPDRRPVARAPPAASSGRWASASGCRACSSRPSPAAATCPTTRSTTPRPCGSSRRSSAPRCPTSPPWRRSVTGDMTQALALGPARQHHHPDAAQRAARRAGRRRADHPQRAHRHLRRGLHLHAAHHELDARPGDQAGCGPSHRDERPP